MMITYVRGMENVRFADLTRKTVQAVYDALKRRDAE